MDGLCEVMPLPGRDVAMDLSVRDNKSPWKRRKEESDEEDRKPSSSTHDVSNGSPEDGSNPHKPQDLRLRRILNEGRINKKERLEEMVNHIRKVSAEQQRPLSSTSWSQTSRRECSDDTSDEEGAWRPEDIFFLRSKPSLQDDGHSPQDLRVKRPRPTSPSPPTHPPSAPTAALVQRFLQMALPWPSYESQASYLPWMAYNYYAQLTRHQYGGERRGDEEEVVETTSQTTRTSPSHPSRPSSHPSSHPSTTRKRAPRALTGKHVKQGTGASPATLQTLRQAIQERQRARPTSQAMSSGRAKTSRRKAPSSTATSASASRHQVTPSAPIVP